SSTSSSSNSNSNSNSHSHSHSHSTSTSPSSAPPASSSSHSSSHSHHPIDSATSLFGRLASQTYINFHSTLASAFRDSPSSSSLGHQNISASAFALTNRPKNSSAPGTHENESGPIFLQFLDCVYQLLSQHPSQFQFNLRFLLDLHYHCYSCRFGTFLANSASQRIDLDLVNTTPSLWSHIDNCRDDFAASRPCPNPLNFSSTPTTYTFRSAAFSITRIVAWYAASCPLRAAFLNPPTLPPLLFAITFPFRSVSVTNVLLNELLTCSTCVLLIASPESRCRVCCPRLVRRANPPNSVPNRLSRAPSSAPYTACLNPPSRFPIENSCCSFFFHSPLSRSSLLLLPSIPPTAAAAVPPPLCMFSCLSFRLSLTVLSRDGSTYRLKLGGVGCLSVAYFRANAIVCCPD
ncbi:Phosphoinositide 3-phosphatase, partial [Zancudomyces culisetae]